MVTWKELPVAAEQSLADGLGEIAPSVLQPPGMEQVSLEEDIEPQMKATIT